MRNVVAVSAGKPTRIGLHQLRHASQRNQQIHDEGA
jgi:hypothetical protein